jgi:hypothetical protein
MKARKTSEGRNRARTRFLLPFRGLPQAPPQLESEHVDLVPEDLEGVGVRDEVVLAAPTAAPHIESRSRAHP